MNRPDHNITRLSCFLTTCFLLIVVRLVYLQLLDARSIRSRPYVDGSLRELAQDLVQLGIIKQDGEVGTVDKERLESVVRNKKQREQIMRLDEMGSFLVEDGENKAIVLDQHATMMRNPRILRPNGFTRGSILDRNLEVLAYTEATSRRYPYGAALFNVVGHSNIAFGNSRLEAACDRFLGRGKVLPWYRRLFGLGHVQDRGDDVVLTLDHRLQQTAYQLLGGYRGAVVVLSVKTGEILALVSKPSFDPAMPLGKCWVQAERDREAKPFRNRAIEDLYPPGSTFKVVMAAKALQTETFDPRKTLECTGRGRYRISDHHAHGAVDLARGLILSCNVYFSEMGVDFGKEAIQDAAVQFGFERSFDLIPFREGALTTVSSRSADPGVQPHQKGLIAQTAIGQYEVRATPLQMAMVAQTIANDGVPMQPYLIKEIRQRVETDEDPDGTTAQVVYAFSLQPLLESVPPGAARQVKAMMVQVMESGTGQWLKKIYRQAKVDAIKETVSDSGACTTYIASHSTRIKGERIPVGGKTGTAEVGREEDAAHSWFIAFAPADNPKFAISVLAENAGWGATTAGPIAIEVLVTALNLVQ